MLGTFYKQQDQKQDTVTVFLPLLTPTCTISSHANCAPLRSHYTNCAAYPPTYPPTYHPPPRHQFVVMRHLQRSPENPDAEGFLLFFCLVLTLLESFFLVSMKQAGRSNEKQVARESLNQCRLRSVARKSSKRTVSLLARKLLCMCLGTETSATRWFLNSN